MSKAFGITWDFGSKKMAELNSLWCSGLIYLFLTGIHNLLSTSLLWLNQYWWNNQLRHSHQKNFQTSLKGEASKTKGVEKKARRMIERTNHPSHHQSTLRTLSAVHTVLRKTGSFWQGGCPWGPPSNSLLHNGRSVPPLKHLRQERQSI